MPKLLEALKEAKIKDFDPRHDHVTVGAFIRNTLNIDKNSITRSVDGRLPGHAPGQATDVTPQRRCFGRSSI
jgi:hypothetical protein